MEDVTEAQAGAQRAEQGHDVLQRRALRVPDYANAYDFRPVSQRSSDLNLCSARTLLVKIEKLVGISCVSVWLSNKYLIQYLSILNVQGRTCSVTYK